MNIARTTKRQFLTLAVLCTLTVPAGAAPIIEPIAGAHGQVNWSEGVLSVIGAGVRPPDAISVAQGRLLARRAAIADAYRNLAHLVSEVRVTSNTTVERYVNTADTIRLNVEAYVRGAQIVEEKDDADGTYTVTLRVGMTGKESLTGIMLPKIVGAPVLDTKLVAPTLPRVAPTVANLENELLTPVDAPGPFTGLIVDTRGLNIQPAMSPRLYDPSGKEVYGTVQIGADFAEDIGIAGYMGTIRTALDVARVGKNPLVIRAVGSPDEFHRYVTISAADALRVLAENDKSQFLQKCAVIFVVDERRARDEGK